jgi:putative ABC transport system substrate-binding protein
MKRRVVLLSGVAALFCSSAFSQGSRNVKVGILSPTPLAKSVLTPGIVRRLGERGYREGGNMRLEYRSTDGVDERFPQLARELIALKCDLIFAVGPDLAALALRDARSPTPVVFYAADYDPIERGLVGSLSRPDGNLTGVYLPWLDLVGKRMQILREIRPGMRRLLVFSDKYNRNLLAPARKAAQAMGIELVVVEFDKAPYDFAPALEAGRRSKVEGLLVSSSPVFTPQRAELAAQLLASRLPSIGSGLFAESGILIGYGPDTGKALAKAADVGVRILKGAKPAEVPVEQSDDAELVVNARTARALGLKMPESILARATRIVT